MSDWRPRPGTLVWGDGVLPGAPVPCYELPRNSSACRLVGHADLGTGLAVATRHGKGSRHRRPWWVLVVWSGGLACWVRLRPELRLCWLHGPVPDHRETDTQPVGGGHDAHR